MARLVEVGFKGVFKNLAWVQTGISRLESGAKSMSKTFVEAAQETAKLAQNQATLVKASNILSRVQLKDAEAVLEHKKALTTLRDEYRIFQALQAQSKAALQGGTAAQKEAARQRLEIALVTRKVNKANLANTTSILKYKDGLVAAQSEQKQMRADMAAANAEARVSAAVLGQKTRALLIMGLALSATSALLLKFTSDNVEAAASVERLTFALNTLARVYDLNDAAAKKEIEDVMALGFTRAQATDAVMKLVQAEQDFTKATNLATLAKGAGAASGLTAAKALDKLTTSVVNNTTRNLTAVNLRIRRNRLLEDEAQRMGITASLLTEEEEKRAILNGILEKGNALAQVSADVTRTLAGQMELLTIQTTTLKEQFGESLLPALTAFLGNINKVLKSLIEMDEKTKRFIGAFVAAVGVILAVVAAVVMLQVAAAFLAVKLGITAAAVLKLTVGAVAAGTAVGLLAVSMDNAATATDTFSRSLSTVEIFLRAVEQAILDMRGALKPVEDAYDAIKNKTELQLIPLRQWQREAQRTYTILQRVAAIEIKAAEGPLKAAEAQLKRIAREARLLDIALMPFEAALKRIKAQVDLIIIPLKAQRRELQRQLETLKRIIAAERKIIEDVLKKFQRALRDVGDQIHDIEKSLYPFEDAFTRARAAADLVVIPLRRQQRVLEREIEALELISKLEQDRIKRHLEALNRQREALQEIIDVDKARLDVVDHEIFMEEQRNRILSRAASARLLALQSQSALLQDQTAMNQENMDIINDEAQAERDRLREMQDALAKTLAPLQEQLQLLIDAITLEEDRVSYIQETLDLERARRAESLLLLEQERRHLADVIEKEQRRLDTYDELNEKRTESLELQIRALDDIISKEEERAQIAQDLYDLEVARQAEARIAIAQERIYWEDKATAAQEYLDAVRAAWQGRLDAAKAELTFVGDRISELEEEVQLAKDKLDIAKIEHAETMKSLEATRLQLEKNLALVNEIQESLSLGFGIGEQPEKKNLLTWIGDYVKSGGLFWLYLEDLKKYFKNTFSENGSLANDLDKNSTKFEKWKDSVAGERGSITLALDKMGKDFSAWALKTFAEDGTLPKALSDGKTALETWKKDAFGEGGIIPTALDDATKLFRTALAEILTNLNASIKDFKTVGKDMIDGLIQGIEDRAQAAIDAVIKVLKDAWEAAKEWLGAESPSKVYEQIGASMMLGTAIGINKYADVISGAMAGVFGTGVQGFAPNSVSNVTNFYNSSAVGPSVNVEAHYAKAQSVATIKDDVGLMLSYAY